MQCGLLELVQFSPAKETGVTTILRAKLFLLPASSSSTLGFGWGGGGGGNGQINVLKQFALAQSHDIKRSVDFPHVSEHPEDSS